MVLFVENTITEDRQQYQINRLEDFEQLYSMYPAARHFVLTSYSTQDAAERIAKYLSSHHMNAWVDKSDLTKSVKNHALALGLTVAGILGTSLASPGIALAPDVQAQTRKFHNDFGHKPEDAFLWNIMKLESSGGKNTNHPPVKLPSLKSQRALGKWGLLTSTVRDILVRRRAEGLQQKGFSEMEGMSNSDMNKYIRENPHIELELARYLAKHCIKRQAGDHRRAAFSWLNGHNLTPQEISESDLNTSDYVSKYRQADKINPIRIASVKHTKLYKKESTGEFKSRLHNWKKLRFAQKRAELPRDFNFAPDPGRIRDKELDERPKGEVTGQLRDKLADSIEAAKKGIKKV